MRWQVLVTPVVPPPPCFRGRVGKLAKPVSVHSSSQKGFDEVVESTGVVLGRESFLLHSIFFRQDIASLTPLALSWGWRGVWVGCSSLDASGQGATSLNRQALPRYGRERVGGFFSLHFLRSRHISSRFNDIIPVPIHRALMSCDQAKQTKLEGGKITKKKKEKKRNSHPSSNRRRRHLPSMILPCVPSRLASNPPVPARSKKAAETLQRSSAATTPSAHAVRNATNSRPHPSGTCTASVVLRA